MDVNQTIVKVLEDIGVDYVFGGSGQVNASMLLALKKSAKINTIIINNEQAASFMAAGYAMYTDKLGVCFATGGPGAFNLFSGLAVAYSDSIPMLAITGYTSRPMRGKGALNESTGLSRTPDSQAMFSATTKKSVILEDAKDAVSVLEELIYTAFEGRPGPVHLHIPKDITIAKVPFYRAVEIGTPLIYPDESQTEVFNRGFIESFSAENKPLLLIGYGCIRSQAQSVLMELVEKWHIPFATTMDAKGYLPENSEFSLGVFGSSGDKSANEYFLQTKTVLAVGNSFAENATFGFRENLMEGKKLFQINIDRHEIDKVYRSDYRLISDARDALDKLRNYLTQKGISALPENLFTPNKWHDEKLPDISNGKIHPGRLVQVLSKYLPENAIILGDAGAHMLWLSAYLQLTKNQWYQNPGSFGPMASHVNGSIGVKCANPERPVICACGDGGYLMAGFELLTCVKHNIPVVYIIFNNNEYNVIKKFLLANFHEEAFMDICNPDYEKYAEACGAAGWTVRNIAEFEAVLKKAMELKKPCIINAIVDGEVYPPISMSKT
ncbi:MAG: thiamine pyrophosphate-binding protein [Pelosinus sp.]|nr:thiamine pyrophosphate-binding protein [Pelosinus sp.]